METNTSESLPIWGRVLIAGGTDWPILGRKQSEKNEEAPDLPSPHILRDVAHEKIVRVFAGHSACHAFFLNDKGDVYALCRNEIGQCGLPVKEFGTSISTATRLDRTRHFKPALPLSSEGDIVHVSCGRHHTLLCTKDGSVYAVGKNALGQCGNPKLTDLEIFTRIEVATFVKEKDPVIMVGTGFTFSLVCTASGKVYALGSTEKGQLGNGRTGEHFISGNKLAFNTHAEPLLVRALASKKIVEISCGQQHSIAMDEDGYCYVWGFGGHGRLGFGAGQDQLSPVLVPQFAKDNILTRAKTILAGPTNSVVIDRQRMYWLAGKWKTTGDGGAGQGYMSFKYLHELMGCKINKVALGGVTLMAIADEEKSARGEHEATMNIAWGQGAASGELGLGFDQPRSATKPQRVNTLDGISILDVTGGQNTTFYLARNLGPAYAELPSYPSASPEQETCIVCDKGEDTKNTANDLLECERCEEPWHLQCLIPPLDSVPEGEWHCPRCLDLVLDYSKLSSGSGGTSTAKNGKKRAAEEEEEEEEKVEVKKGSSNGKKASAAKKPKGKK